MYGFPRRLRYIDAAPEDVCFAGGTWADDEMILKTRKVIHAQHNLVVPCKASYISMSCIGWYGDATSDIRTA